MPSRKFFLSAIATALLSSVIVAGISGRADSSASEATFSKDVAPIFFEHCAECHRPGEAAPMSLLSYKDARPWARSIREKVLKRQMPPWHADPHYGEFSNDRRLTQRQINTIVAWVDGAAKEGDPADLPAAPHFVEGWSIGKPDLVLQMPEEFTLEASGPDEYQYFEIPTNFKQDVFVQRAEARPGNRRIVHHIIAFVVPPAKDGSQRTLTREDIERARKENEKRSIFYKDGFLMRVKADAPVVDDGCSIANGGGGDTIDFKRDQPNLELLAGFAPGMNPAILDAGTVKRIPAGSKILLQMHYSKTARSVQKDRSMVGLIFAKTPGDKHQYTWPIANTYFRIPPGAENHEVTACWTANDDIHLQTLMPHMHLRGKSMRIEAFYPNGKSEILLNVPQYDFSWQTVYYLKKPVALPKGTKLVVTAHFDNSSKNKYNPDPAQAVRFGDPTYDDMMIGWINYTVDKEHLSGEALNATRAGK
jgi:mono/diheme cytochrome c family protein